MDFTQDFALKREFLGQKSIWKFASDLNSNNSKLNSKLIIDSVDCLRFEGIYDSHSKRWRRVYLTREGITIQLQEEISEAGGQKCLWTAGVVMAKFLEYSFIRNFFQDLVTPIVLEVGAGAGLPSMIVSLLGYDVIATEQRTCLPYLKSNLQLNKDVVGKVKIEKLNWESAQSIKNESNIDIIIGCDITYDDRNYCDLFEIFNRYLRKSGIALICHDNDACPMNENQYNYLHELAHIHEFTMKLVDLRKNYVPLGFQCNSIYFWEICRAH